MHCNLKADRHCASRSALILAKFVLRVRSNCYFRAYERHLCFLSLFYIADVRYFILEVKCLKCQNYANFRIFDPCKN